MKLNPRHVKQFLSHWIAVQNGHDFGRYSRLYAPDFIGVKRASSGRKTEYRRAAWLADRRPMMDKSKHLHLSAENVRIHVEEGAAIVTFDQYFSTRNYADWGPKVLRLRPVRGDLYIVHEEMLTSYKLPVGECC